MSATGEEDARRALVAAARRMHDLGLNPGRSGNASLRWQGGFLVTPSGLAYDRLGPGDMAFVDAAGEPQGAYRPSSEWRLHRDVYARRPEAGGIAHTHSPFATTLACLRRPIPPFHYEVAFAGGADIRCAPYATFGTQQLSDLALAALEGRRACLLANHGAIAIGATLQDAVELAERVEALARLYCQALQLGEPVLLEEVEMARVVEKFRGYGKQGTTPRSA